MKGLAVLPALALGLLGAAQPRPPATGALRALTTGDLMCYATVEAGGTRREVPATFEVCETGRRFIGHRVGFVYRHVRVADCRSAEPCGRSRTVLAIASIVERSR